MKTHNPKHEGISRSINKHLKDLNNTADENNIKRITDKIAKARAHLRNENLRDLLHDNE